MVNESDLRFLDRLNDHLKHAPYLVGERPGSADFGCLGQLTQLVQFDLTPSKLDEPMCRSCSSIPRYLRGARQGETIVEDRRKGDKNSSTIY